MSDNLIEEELGSQENSNDQGQAYIGMSKFTDRTSQDCKHLFIDMKFRGKFLSWRNSTFNNWDYNSIGPTHYPTDYGTCCLFVPHLNFNSAVENGTYQDKFHRLIADSKNGENNGLTLLLDVEAFNYAYEKTNSVGFKIALHHHSDQPIMQFSSQLINPGEEIQINLKPSITYTTDYAISTLCPKGICNNLPLIKSLSMNLAYYHGKMKFNEA